MNEAQNTRTLEGNLHAAHVELARTKAELETTKDQIVKKAVHDGVTELTIAAVGIAVTALFLFHTKDAPATELTLHKRKAAKRSLLSSGVGLAAASSLLIVALREAAEHKQSKRRN